MTTITTAGAVTIIVVAFLTLVTFYALVATTQRHYLRVQQFDMNGRTAEDLVAEAKAVERIARARQKEANALDRIAERKAVIE